MRKIMVKVPVDTCKDCQLKQYHNYGWACPFRRYTGYKWDATEYKPVKACREAEIK